MAGPLVAAVLAGVLLQNPVGPSPGRSQSPPPQTSSQVGTGQAGSSLDTTGGASQLPIDYGDAPESYHTGEMDDGPSHLITPKLMLGASESSDADGRGTAAATSDKDDDGLATVPPLSPKATSYHVKVAVTNRLSRAATLAGWIDTNGDGAFEQNERAVATVPPGATSVPLDWTGLHGVKGASTYLRLRLFGRRAAGPGSRHGDDGDCLPVGYGGIGEVEDYRVLITAGSTAATLPSGVTFRKTADRYRARPGDRVQFTVTVTDNLFRPQFAAFTDDLAQVLDNGSFGHDETASRGVVTYSGGVVRWSGTVRPNDPVTVTYSVTAQSRGVMNNRIVSNRGNCVRGSWDPFCHIRVVIGFHPGVRPGPVFPAFRRPLPFTGAPVDMLLRLAGLLLVTGTAALAFTPRSRAASRRPRSHGLAR